MSVSEANVGLIAMIGVQVLQICLQVDNALSRSDLAGTTDESPLDSIIGGSVLAHERRSHVDRSSMEGLFGENVQIRVLAQNVFGSLTQLPLVALDASPLHAGAPNVSYPPICQLYTCQASQGLQVLVLGQTPGKVLQRIPVQDDVLDQRTIDGSYVVEEEFKRFSRREIERVSTIQKG